MKFITCILAMFFIFAVPVSARAFFGDWKYVKSVDEMTDETSSSAKSVTIDAGAGVGTITSIVCEPDRELAVALIFIGESRYARGGRFDITVRFDQEPAFDMNMYSLGSELKEYHWSSPFASFASGDSALNHATEREKFIRGLRTRNRLRLKPEQQSSIYEVSLNGSREPIGLVLRDCGRDDLLD